MPNRHFLRGLRDGFPIGLGYFAVSFGLGISCRAANLTAFQGFLLSFLNNASAGEYGGITIIASDSGFLIMAAMMLVVNARYMLMSCALSQHLSPDTPLIFRLIIGYDLTDELFGIAISQPGYLNVWYYIGAMCAAMPCWSAGTVIGVLLGNLMPVWAVSGFSVMLFGMFIAIIVPMGKRDRVVLGCIIVSFLLGWLASVLPGSARTFRGYAHSDFDHRDLGGGRCALPAEGRNHRRRSRRRGGARRMKTYLYILVMAATTYLIRVLPLTLIRKPIRSVFLRSFLFYVPYVTLSVMTFPAIMNATQSPIAGAAAMVIGIIAAWCGLGLFPVSLICCASVIALEFFIV